MPTPECVRVCALEQDDLQRIGFLPIKFKKAVPDFCIS
jgi:hypothetical protein